MEQTTALLELLQGDDLRAHTQRMNAEVLAETMRGIGHAAYYVSFALAALFLLAWALWPRRRVWTPRGWRDLDAAPLAPGEARGGVGPGGESMLRIERAHAGFAGGILLSMLCAISQQIAIDHERGFIQDQHRKMNAKLRQVREQARQEFMASMPQGQHLSAAELQMELKRAADAARENFVQTHYLYLPRGDSLRRLTLDNPALAADYLWLTSLQYVSSPYRQGQKWDMLHRFYSEILELDPHWVEIHINAGKVLSALEPDRGKTELFLNRAMTRNPGDYQLPMEAGRLYVVPPADPDQLPDYSRRASEYFDQAQERKNLPTSERAALDAVLAVLKREAGLYSASVEKLRAVIDDTETPQPVRENAARELLQAESLVRVDLFQRMVKSYRNAHGDQAPPDLKAALRDFAQRGQAPEFLKPGLEGAVPLDAFGMALEYDARQGVVSSRGVQALRAIQTKTVLEVLLAMFQGNQQRYPSDMQELSDFLRWYYKPPRDDPPYTVVEVLGRNLDATRNPLGGTWSYDKRTGSITLPPECNLQELYRGVDRVLQGLLPAYFR